MAHAAKRRPSATPHKHFIFRAFRCGKLPIYATFAPLLPDGDFLPKVKGSVNLAFSVDFKQFTP
ncbi:MAG: hypothetical protein CMN32_00520 [Saprospirales bacterium]|nr:hypothetical protein [Saprospirales bacterium]